MKADKRVFCHESLFLTNKLQGSGYMQECAAWDEDDSDSNVSDEVENDIAKLAR